MMHPYFKNPLVSLYYSREKRLGMAVWQGHIKGADYREALLLCLELMERFGLRGWLEDNRQVQAVDTADRTWGNKVMDSRLAAGPLLRLARLSSDARLPALSAGVTGIDGDGSLHLRDFEEPQEALHWLQNVPADTAAEAQD